MISREAHADNLPKQFSVLLIVDTVIQRYVEGMMSARIQRISRTKVVWSTSAWKEVDFIVLVKRECHYTIRRPERLFYSVAMVYIDIDVQDTRMMEQQLKYGDYDIVDVAKSRCSRLFGMMEAT